MFFEKAEIHIYMKKANVTENLKTEWINKLKTEYPDIDFEIKTLEDYIK